MSDSNDETLVWVYVAVGIWVNSTLHTWYVSEVYPGVRLSLPFTDYFGVGAPVPAGYVGAIVAGAFAGFVGKRLLERLPDLHELSLPDVFQYRMVGLAGAGGTAVLVVSQLIGGASWSKAVLDVVLLFCGGMLLLSYVYPLSLWNLLSIYAAIVSVLLAVGAQWIDFAERFQYPHFPSFTYFALSSIFILGASAGWIALNNLQRSPAPTGPTPAFRSRGRPSSVDSGERYRVAGRPTLDEVRRRYDALFPAREGRVDTRSTPSVARLDAFFSTVVAFLHDRASWLLLDHLSDEEPQNDRLEAFLEGLSDSQREELLRAVGLIDEETGERLRKSRRFGDDVHLGRVDVDDRELLEQAAMAHYLAVEMDTLLKDRLS